VIFHTEEPDRLLAARNGSPLVIGLGSDETIIASDVAAIIRHTDRVVYLDDGEIAEINRSGHQTYHLENGLVEKQIEQVEWQVGEAEKKGHKHFMLKEIYEQPRSIQNSIRGRMIIKDGKIKLGGLDSIMNITRYIERAVIVACGTARHAGLVGQIMLEEYAGLPTTVELASEFRYRKPIIDKKTAVIAISQSGETADTLAAIKEAKLKGALTLGIVNSVGSTISRVTDAGVFNHIGPEIAVASTKAYTSQLAILVLLTVLLGRERQMSVSVGKRILEELNAIPVKIEEILAQDKKIKSIAKKYYRADNMAFMGRKYNYPTAIEGALKLKELSYLHAEGFASGEMKHGSISMVDPNFPSFFIVPKDSVYDKNVSNMEEIKSRKGRIIAVTTKDNNRISKLADDTLYIPKTLEILTPILATIPTQLFAYYVSLMNNRDVDKPRNLAKSVTVE
jgi:glucosamine--fructose-6-phosphate aminotransferase (isomerizing)